MSFLNCSPKKNSKQEAEGCPPKNLVPGFREVCPLPLVCKEVCPSLSALLFAN